MSKRNDPVARARGRKAAPVKKPFPVGFVAGSAVLVLFIAGILIYAVNNQGLGDKTSIRYAESQIDGIHSTRSLDGASTRQHIPYQAIPYANEASIPPWGGDHNPLPQSCQVYTQPIANEHAVHSLEHGAVWVTYNPDTVKSGDIDKLKSMVDGQPFDLMSPYPGLKSPIALTAWGEQVFVNSASDSRVAKFINLFAHGPQDLEANTPCQGTTATGPITSQKATPDYGAIGAPSTSASASPTSSPSPSPSPTK